MKVQSSELEVRNERIPTLTPTLSLRARGIDERGRVPFIPVMLSLSKHLFILCTVVIFSACGGGGGGSSPTSPGLSTSFSGTSSPGNNTVYMAKNNSLSSGDVIAIDVRLNNVSDYVYGTAFGVDFDSTKIDFIGYAIGSLLEQGGKTAEYMWAENSNEVIFGITRLGGVGGVSGSGTLVTLKFKAVAAGNSTISFGYGSLKDPALNTITINSWDGGTVAVQ